MLLFGTPMSQSRYVIITPLFKKHTLQDKESTSWFDTVHETSVKTFYSVMAVLQFQPQRHLNISFPTTTMQDDKKPLFVNQLIYKLIFASYMFGYVQLVSVIFAVSMTTTTVIPW